MNLLPGLTWFTSMATRRAPQGGDTPDPADMGTAFGLDASMAPEASETPPTAGAGRSPSATPSQADRLVRRPRR